MEAVLFTGNAEAIADLEALLQDPNQDPKPVTKSRFSGPVQPNARR
jgi:hypothetical protein